MFAHRAWRRIGVELVVTAPAVIVFKTVSVDAFASVASSTPNMALLFKVGVEPELE